MSAVDKINEHIRNARGTRFIPEELPFELVHEDDDYARGEYGHLVQYVFEVPTIETTQTPRKAYVAIVAEVTRDEGIEDPSGWQVEEVEKKTKSVIVWEKK